MAFKIEKKEYVNKTFRISKDLADRLAITAQENGISTNELVVQACEHALKSLEKEE